MTAKWCRPSEIRSELHSGGDVERLGRRESASTLTPIPQESPPQSDRPHQRRAAQRKHEKQRNGKARGTALPTGYTQKPRAHDTDSNEDLQQEQIDEGEEPLGSDIDGGS